MSKILLYSVVLAITTQGSFASKKAKLMCKSYSKNVYVFEHSPTMHARLVSHWTSKCGIVEIPLIVGGRLAHDMEFPHMAAIGFGDAGAGIKNMNWMCGGSLISENFVLSAAHCVRNRQYGAATQVLLGANSLKKIAGSTKLIGIKRAIPHPKYIARSKYHDIALFELVRNIQFNAYVRPACLNTNTNSTWSTALASGYGQLSFEQKQRSDNLKKVTLKNISEDDCKKTYPIRRYMSDGLIGSQFCAGDMAGGKDTCQGDSGGPLQTVLTDPYCMYNIIGITSFGKFCGFENSPGIYTSVAHYIDWIESNVWP